MVPALLGMVLMTGCAAAADTTVDHVQADVTFSKDMIGHHQETIRLAEAGAKQGGSAYVRDLSKKLIAAEQTDIDMMASWLQSWQVAVPVAGARAAGADIPAGDGFDEQWLKALSEHLKHGVHMSEQVKTEGEHGPTKEMAERLIKEQSAELAEIDKRLS
ncbi:Uncharacterized conserved protein, DUF305 family [Nonomuraea solani]|uniref:Uncharacterized conserved protein, DUF305 family n=1 Tax=Nonomuraea solani TaxID=1144553 RepID=A0A1H6EPX1_9ACTN|nr:DUF305 domain-containing protein [Nonomuraea solani]SEG99920.1 Uncharacterized conserved protein, DUF305 family [Nonomuraea solani]